MLTGLTKLRVEDLNWSDEEDCDEKYLVKHWDVANRNDDDESLDSFQINEKTDKEQTSLIGIDRLADHRRSKYSGYVTVDKKLRANPVPSKNSNILSPPKYHYPTVPSDVKHILGDENLQRLWKEFVKYGADESELLLVSHVRSIGTTLQAELNLPFNKLNTLRDMESEDFMEFSTLSVELAKYYKPTERLLTSKPSTALCHVCCAIGACRHRSTIPGTLSRGNTSTSAPFRTSIIAATYNEEKNMDDQSSAEGAGPDNNNNNNNEDDTAGSVFSEMEFVNSEDHRLSVIFSHIKHSLQGKVRNRHINEVMDRLGIPYAKNRLPASFWMNRGEMYIKSMDELKKLIHLVRTDLDVKVDPLAAMFKFELPQWLREEFKDSEIMLYEHHFSLIDIDNGGSIDVDELQALITNFGSKISRPEAQALLDEYDMDGGGTIDFVEFMVLIYKIQRGTIDLSSSDLAKVLVEAKAQLKIFEEIEEVSRNPPPFCTIAHFGGSPVACNVNIQGPTGTPYEGVQMTFQIIFHDGYPFRQPDIQFQGRVMSLHVLPQLSGDARLMHIKEVWTAEWGMHRLLLHTVDVLTYPEPDLLPDAFYGIYKAWEDAWERKCAELKTALQREIAQQACELLAAAAEEEAAQSKALAEDKATDESADHKAQDKTPSNSAPRSARTGGGDIIVAESKLAPTAGTGVQSGSCRRFSSRPPSGPTCELLPSETDSKAGSRRPSHSLREDVVGARAADSKCSGSARGDSGDGTGASDGAKKDNNGSKNVENRVEDKMMFSPSQTEIEKTEIPVELWQKKRRNLARSVTMDDLSDSGTHSSILRLSRIERMHLGTMLLYLTDRKAYDETIAVFMKTHGRKPSVDEEQE